VLILDTPQPHKMRDCDVLVLIITGDGVPSHMIFIMKKGVF
jgi:hypothetical protein